jgi:DNA-binding response OmpR family regulator
MRILIVDDELELVDTISDYLTTDTFVCEAAPTYETALNKIENNEYDCILLDLKLPDGNGLNLFKDLQAQRNKLGVIIISGLGHIEDKVLGLEVGADDYLPKPIDLPELEARIKALYRRLNDEDENRRIVTDGIEICDSVVCVDGVNIGLTPKETRILIRLIESHGKYITKDSLYESACYNEFEHCGNVDIIYHHLTNIRKKLQKHGVKPRIESKYGFGYRWGDKWGDK